MAEATGLQLLEERDADFRSELFQFTLFDCVQLGTPPLLFGRGADPVIAAAFGRFFSRYYNIYLPTGTTPLCKFSKSKREGELFKERRTKLGIHSFSPSIKIRLRKDTEE